MTRPHFFAFIEGSASRTVWNDAVRLIAMTAFHLSIGKLVDRRDELDPCVVDENVDRPELVERRSPSSLRSDPASTNRPRRKRTRTSCSVVIDARNASIAVASPKPLRMTFAPSRANARAMPRPMPLVEPVTSAVFPCNMIVPLRWRVGPGCTVEATDASRFGRALEPDVLPLPPCSPVANLVTAPHRNLQSRKIGGGA